MRGRYLAVLWLFFPFLSSGLISIIGEAGELWPWYWWDVVFYYYWHFTFAVLLFIITKYSDISVKKFFNRSPSASEYISGFKLTIFLLIFSIATAFVLFYPLSFIFPRFVEYWYIDLPPIIYFDLLHYPFLPNILGFTSLCVFAPVLEEYAFRGVLLGRWSEKWGKWYGVLASSLLFSLVHPDPIGAFAFGIGMCFLYLKTQSLLLPIVCHSFNNFVVWLIDLGFVVYEGPDYYYYTLEQFQEEWYIGLVFVIIALVWGVTYFNRLKSNDEWKQHLT